MQPSAILQRAFPVFQNAHCLRFSVDPHPVSDRGQKYEGWIIRAHFSIISDPAPAVAYARIVNGYVAFCRVSDTTPQPFHRGPDNKWAGWPDWSNEIIREAEWRQFADHAPHYSEQPVAELQERCQRHKGHPHRWVTSTPEWRLVGWFPAVDRDGNLTGEVVEGSRFVSWYRLDPQAHCVVLESHGDQRNRLEEEQLQQILGPGGTVVRGSDSIEMTLGGVTRWGNNPRHAVEVAEELRRRHDAAQETAQV